MTLIRVFAAAVLTIAETSCAPVGETDAGISGPDTSMNESLLQIECSADRGALQVVYGTTTELTQQLSLSFQELPNSCRMLLRSNYDTIVAIDYGDPLKPPSATYAASTDMPRTFVELPQGISSWAIPLANGLVAFKQRGSTIVYSTARKTSWTIPVEWGKIYSNEGSLLVALSPSSVAWCDDGSVFIASLDADGTVQLQDANLSTGITNCRSMVAMNNIVAVSSLNEAVVLKLLSDVPETCRLDGRRVVFVIDSKSLLAWNSRRARLERWRLAPGGPTLERSYAKGWAFINASPSGDRWLVARQSFGKGNDYAVLSSDGTVVDVPNKTGIWMQSR